VRQAAEALRRAEALPTPRAGRTAGLLLPMSFLATFSAFGAAVVVWPSSDAGAEVAGLEDEPPASPHGMARQPGSGAPDDPHGMARQAGADLPDDLTALNAMAYAALLQGQLPTAMAAVEKARALAPDDPDARTNLDVMRMNVGMVDRAAEDLGKLVEAYPDRPRPLLWLAFARGKQGRDEEARTLLARVLALQPEGEEATLARQWLAELDPAPAATP
jgi:tetratricopeptide (TPR) repeat protein